MINKLSGNKTESSYTLVSEDIKKLLNLKENERITDVEHEIDKINNICRIEIKTLIYHGGEREEFDVAEAQTTPSKG